MSTFLQNSFKWFTPCWWNIYIYIVIPDSLASVPEKDAYGNFINSQPNILINHVYIYIYIVIPDSLASVPEKDAYGNYI